MGTDICMPPAPAIAGCTIICAEVVTQQGDMHMIRRLSLLVLRQLL
eukprot:SAG11_NODE_19542_length_464_cov_1.295890_2_plen_45_part_01